MILRTGAMLRQLLLIAVLLVAHLCLQSQAQQDAASNSPAVHVSLRSGWSKSAFVVELLEAAHEEAPSSFFDFVSLVTGPWLWSSDGKETEQTLATATPKQVFEKTKVALDRAGLLQDKAARQRWEASLALRAQSSKVAAFAHLYRTSGVEERWRAAMETATEEREDPCGSWVDWYGEVLCSREEVQSRIERLKADNLPRDEYSSAFTFDHVLSHPLDDDDDDGDGDQAVSATLYGDPASSNFYELHLTLSEYALGARPESPFRYRLRWRPTQVEEEEEADNRDYLAGFGASLDLKKVDYLVLDDRAVPASSGAKDADVGKSQGNNNDEEAEMQQEDRRWLDAQLSSSSNLKNDKEEGAIEDRSGAGMRAAYFVARNENPLRALRQLSQDFPLHAQALANSKEANPSPAFIEEMHTLHGIYMEAATTDAWLNGRSLSSSSAAAATTAMSALTLLPLVRQERRLVDSLVALDLSAEAAVTLLTYPPLQQQPQLPNSQVAEDVYFDASDRKEGGGVLSYWNDVEAAGEEDAARVARFHPELRGLLRPLYPGSFPTVKRNLFNVVLLMDLRRAETCRFLAESVLLATQRLAIRWAFVPTGLDEPMSESTKLARLYWLAMDRGGTALTAEYLARLGGSGKSKSPRQTPITVDEASAQLLDLLSGGNEDDSQAKATIDAALHPDNDWTERETKVRRYAKRLGIATTVSSEEDVHINRGDVFINGRHVPFTTILIQHIHQIIAQQVQLLAPLVYYGTLTDDEDVSTHFYDRNTTFTARSLLVFPPVGRDSSITTDAVDLVQLQKTVEDSTLLHRFTLPRSHLQQKTKKKGVEKKKEEPIHTTLWLVGDFDHEKGVTLLRETIQAQLSMERPFRLGLVHASSSPSRAAGPVARAIYRQLVVDGATATSEDLLEVLDHASTAVETSVVDEAAHRFWQKQARLARFFGLSAVTDSMRSLPFSIVINGRITSGFDVETVDSVDIESLVTVERQRRITPVVEALESSSTLLDVDAITTVSSVVGRASFVDAANAAATSLFQVQQMTARSTVIDDLPTTNGLTSFELGVKNKEDARLRLILMVDPLSHEAQRWSSLLEHLLQLDDSIWIRVLLNPSSALSFSTAEGSDKAMSTSPPLRRFYRASCPARLEFDEHGQLKRPRASFYGMPAEAVLTMAIEAPPSWVTMASEAVHDLDNIRLSDVARADGNSAEAGSVVTATYDVKHVLIEGHARDVTKSLMGRNSAPRGLELVLETLEGKTVDDTIVMANLAYLQLRAPSPGVYRLKIRGSGSRSAELYEMVNVGHSARGSNRDEEESGENIDNLVTVDSSAGLTIFPRFRKRKGREMERLVFDDGNTASSSADIDDESEGGPPSLLTFASSLLKDALRRLPLPSFNSIKAGAKGKEDKINVFTVASGHLYERMASLMILSVLRHTQTPCKFWFIENFLSPSFKQFLPHLAQEYGFEYEMVTYAWPHWLRAQTEKQRQIWGYKVLFLDVLFPLDVSRIIFVDADQIVRADLLELVQLDLQGKPYGFPPMGNDSYDMDNYRFWESGYWKNFLRGHPYPISALYVVDLARFRLLAAGDRLRGHYQALSADSGSLSNLDQDLVASLIHEVPIFGLEKEWLWCETWCSWDWQAQAKSIDLCSNPKTKEPKLDRARRQIPEWTELDEEVAAFAERIRRSGNADTKEDESHSRLHDEL